LLSHDLSRLDLLAYSKVGYLYLTLAIKQDVVKLDISVEDVSGV